MNTEMIRPTSRFKVIVGFALLSWCISNLSVSAQSENKPKDDTPDLEELTKLMTRLLDRIGPELVGTFDATAEINTIMKKLDEKLLESLPKITKWGEKYHFIETELYQSSYKKLAIISSNREVTKALLHCLSLSHVNSNIHGNYPTWPELPEDDCFYAETLMRDKNPRDVQEAIIEFVQEGEFSKLPKNEKAVVARVWLYVVAPRPFGSDDLGGREFLSREDATRRLKTIIRIKRLDKSNEDECKRLLELIEEIEKCPYPEKRLNSEYFIKTMEDGHRINEEYDRLNKIGKEPSLNVPGPNPEK